MLVLRPLLLITLLIVGDCSARRPDDHSSEEVSPNCDDGLAAIGLARPCTTTATIGTTPMTTVSEADWCRFNNGTTLPLGYTFLYRNCSLCECTRMKTIRCQSLQCLAAYCVDGSTPSRREGACCAQCKSDNSSDSCSYKGINYPHGTVMKSIEGKMQCWCQWGQIECRQFISSIFGSFDVLADSATIMLMVMILIVVLVFGLLVCCSFSFIFYFYYQRNRDTFQQAYDQYLNSMGWQPMEEEGIEGAEEKQGEEYLPEVVYDAAEQKRIEAEQSQYTGESIPPPYAIFDQPRAAKDGGESPVEAQRQ